jgi:hypothetical protein
MVLFIFMMIKHEKDLGGVLFFDVSLSKKNR